MLHKEMSCIILHSVGWNAIEHVDASDSEVTGSDCFVTIQEHTEVIGSIINTYLNQL